MESRDKENVMDILESGIKTGNATFETKVPDWATWDSNHLKDARFVYEENEHVLGWVALSPVSTRECYKGVAEISVYVKEEESAKGIGSALMQKAINASEKLGIWTLFSSVFPENKATLHLQQKHGFRKIGIRERIAKHHGKWRDTLILERRSKNVGVTN